MSILDIVLVIELVLLAAIAIVLLVALLQRNRQNRQVYPCTGGTCLYTPNPYLPVGTYPGLYGSGSTTFAQMPEMTSGQFPYDQMPVGKASGQMPAGPASDGRMPSGRTAFSNCRMPGGGSQGQAAARRSASSPAPESRVFPSGSLEKAGESFRQRNKTIITPGVDSQALRDNDHGNRYGSETLNAHVAGKAAGRLQRWRVDFIELNSGRRVSRDFRNHLVVGRMVNSSMESGRLYLSMDATVSRTQFCLFVSDAGLMLENLSNVNITRKNGCPVWQPVPLEEGDILQLGRMRYLVKEIQPAA